MDAASMVPALMSQCLFSLPFAGVWVVAGTMIVMRVRNNRTAVSMALAGIGLAAIELALGLGSSLIIPLTMVQQGVSTTTAVMALSVLSIVRSFNGAISWGLVLAALIMALGRPETPDQS